MGTKVDRERDEFEDLWTLCIVVVVDIVRLGNWAVVCPTTVADAEDTNIRGSFDFCTSAAESNAEADTTADIFIDLGLSRVCIWAESRTSDLRQYIPTNVHPP